MLQKMNNNNFQQYIIYTIVLHEIGLGNYREWRGEQYRKKGIRKMENNSIILNTENEKGK